MSAWSTLAESTSTEAQEQFWSQCKLLARQHGYGRTRYLDDAIQEIAISLWLGDPDERAGRRADRACQPMVKYLPQRNVTYFQGAGESNDFLDVLIFDEHLRALDDPDDDIKAAAVDRAIEMMDDPLQTIARFYWGIDRQMLSVPELADIYGLTRTTVYAMVKDARRQLAHRLYSLVGLSEAPLLVI